MQPVVFDQNANALGAALMYATELTVGSRVAQIALNQVHGDDPSAFSGSLPSFAGPAGAVVQLDGVFF